MPIRTRLAAAITESLLGGEWTAEAMLDRAQSLFAEDHPRTWLGNLIDQVLTTFPATSPLPIRRKLIPFVIAVRIPRTQRPAGSLRLKRQLPEWASAMRPPAGPASNWSIPAIVSIAQLADWLGITMGELEWFANLHEWSSRSGRQSCQHYRYRWIEKPAGGRRLLETPMPRLKQLQRRILDEILNHVPPHSAAHAYRSSRSVATFVAPHAQRFIVLHIDLREFFPSVEACRVSAIFRTMGYPEPVARLLTGLCVNAIPAEVLRTGLTRRDDEASWLRHRAPHLPQGAPTSPALANLAAYRLDARLLGLARAVSARYTRYADDLVFSGERDLHRCLQRFRLLVNAIVLDEGFGIRHRKTHVMCAGTRQQVAGIRLNSHANIPRESYDELKAILHNCRRFGPGSQNRGGHEHFREHLQGRLAYWSAICPSRIAKLKKAFDEIDWTGD